MSGEERRAQLLDVARGLFAEHGYRTTTAEVARAAGVSDALVVKHFGTKENLFRATVVEPLVELFEAWLLEGRQRVLTDTLGEPGEHLDLLRDFGRQWTELILEHRGLLISLVRGSAEFADEATQVLGLVHQLVEDVVRVIEQYSAVDGYRTFSSRTATYATLGALTFGALMAEDPATFTEEYYDLLYFGVLTPEARSALGR
jgi:AcrR family transcriptional regulator